MAAAAPSAPLRELHHPAPATSKAPLLISSRGVGGGGNPAKAGSGAEDGEKDRWRGGGKDRVTEGETEAGGE